MYYRASVHKATGCSPALLMLGRELRLPLDILYPVPTSEYEISPNQYVKRMEETLQKASEFARKHMEIAWQQREAPTKRSRQVKPIDIQRPVYVFNPATPKGRTPKLARLWRGPYQVVEKIDDYLYRVQTGGRGHIQVLHRYHLFQPPAAHTEEQQC